MTTAVTYYPLTANVTSKQILQGIASGLLGAQAFQGGNATAALGLALHYLIAFVWTIVFYMLAKNIRVLTRWPLIVGPLYGTFVWLVMNLVVLPLSHVHAPPAASATVDCRRRDPDDLHRRAHGDNHRATACGDKARVIATEDGCERRALARRFRGQIAAAELDANAVHVDARTCPGRKLRRRHRNV